MTSTSVHATTEIRIFHQCAFKVALWLVCLDVIRPPNEPVEKVTSLKIASSAGPKIGNYLSVIESS